MEIVAGDSGAMPPDALQIAKVELPHNWTIGGDTMIALLLCSGQYHRQIKAFRRWVPCLLMAKIRKDGCCQQMILSR